MPSFDVQHLTDFEKMRYYCANMQTFAAHYSTRGNWPKLFTALIRVIFRINTHFTHLFGKRCWNCTILPWQKPFWSVNIQENQKSSIWKWQRRHFRKLLEVARFSLHDVTKAGIARNAWNARTNKLPSSPPLSSPEPLGLICNRPVPTTWPRNDGLWGREWFTTTTLALPLPGE